MDALTRYISEGSGVPLKLDRIGGRPLRFHRGGMGERTLSSTKRAHGGGYESRLRLSRGTRGMFRLSGPFRLYRGSG